MGWFGKIVLGIILLGVLAILADIVTWIYEVAWIIPIIIALVVVYFIWRQSLARKKMKIKQLVKAALVDGKLSEKERSPPNFHNPGHRPNASSQDLPASRLFQKCQSPGDGSDGAGSRWRRRCGRCCRCSWESPVLRERC